MMFKRQYHFLVAGLADIAFDSSKSIINMKDFLQGLKSVLHPADYSKVSILFLSSDNTNLVAFLKVMMNCLILWVVILLRNLQNKKG